MKQISQIRFCFQTQSLEKILLLGGCPTKMVLGMAMYGKTYKLVDPSQTGIGAPTDGTGNPGEFTQESVSVNCEKNEKFW